MTGRIQPDASEWIVSCLDLNPSQTKQLQNEGIKGLYVSQLQTLLNEIGPHLEYAVQTPTEKEGFVEAIETALKDPATVQALMSASSSLNDDDSEHLSPFRQAFGQAMLRIMGNKFDKKQERKSRKNRKANKVRRRAHSHDGLLSSDDEASVDDDGLQGEQPEPVTQSERVRPTRRHVPPTSPLPPPPPHNDVPTNITMGDDGAMENLEQQVYTTSLNDSGRGATPLRPRSVHSIRRNQLSTSSHQSSQSSDMSADLKSYDGYASSDDGNFMNDVGHKGLPGGRDYLSDDGSVDSMDSFDLDD